VMELQQVLGSQIKATARTQGIQQANQPGLDLLKFRPRDL
jgi:hypothetical protein